MGSRTKIEGPHGASKKAEGELNPVSQEDRRQTDGEGKGGPVMGCNLPKEAFGFGDGGHLLLKFNLSPLGVAGHLHYGAKDGFQFSGFQRSRVDRGQPVKDFPFPLEIPHFFPHLFFDGDSLGNKPDPPVE
jgi:hypothetical protein